MPVCNLSDLSSLCPKGKCLLGLDPGSTVIGVAISDPDWRVASPLTGLTRGKFAADAAALGNIVRERNIGALIIGLPKNMDGSEGPAAQSARSFAANLLRKGNVPNPDMPIVFWDERMSTAAVTRFMLEDDMSRRRRAETVDKAAAAYILQGALDALSAMTPEPRSE
jgi:putative Holliday junction resolvase